MDSERLATPGRRFAGWALDCGVGSVVFGLPLIRLAGDDPEPGRLLALNICAMVAAFAYLIFFDARGATPGKRLVGTCVVDETTQEAGIGYRRAAQRRFGYLVGWLALTIGWWWLLWDPKRQAWHDKFADTLVVRAH